MRKWLLIAAAIFGLAGPAHGQALVDISCAPPGSTQPVACRSPGVGNATYPPGSTPITNAATGTTAGATATLPGVAGKFTYLCGFQVSVGAATGAITITITTTGLSSNWTLSAGAPVAAAGTTGPIVSLPSMNQCLPASAVNTPITVVAGALGAGGVNQSVNAWGFQQ